MCLFYEGGRFFGSVKELLTTWQHSQKRFTRSTAGCGIYILLYFIHMVHGYRRLHASSELYYRLLCFLTDIEDIGSLRVNGEFVTMRKIEFCGK